MSDNNDELIGRIYDSATNPGDWFGLIEAIIHYTLPEVTQEGLEVHHSPKHVENLIQHLERATRNNDYIQLLENQRMALSTVYHNMPWPMLMLDAHMQVIDANQAAHHCLTAETQNSFYLDDLANLHIKDASLKKQLLRILNFELGKETQLLQTSDKHLSLLCLPMAKMETNNSLANLRAVVWVLSSDQKIVPSEQIIRSLFDVTGAEARLLHTLCHQGNLASSAASLGISIHTARTQVKSIMTKNNVSSQVELVSQTMGHSFLQSATRKLTLAPVEVEQKLVLPDGRLLSWTEFGSPKGTPVLVLEGLTGGLPYHPPHQDWYLERNLRVITLIRPGHGISTYKPNLGFTGLIGDIKYLLKYLHIERPTVAAYCCGGTYALCAAATEPTLFKQVGVLGCTVPIEHWELNKLDSMHKLFLNMYRISPHLFSMFMKLAARGMERDPDKSYESIAKVLGGRDAELLRTPHIRRNMIRQTQDRRYQGATLMTDEYLWLQKDWGVDLTTIKVPVLVWHGEADPTISIDSARRMSATIPTATFKSLPNHGRLLAHDVWADFLNTLIP